VDLGPGEQGAGRGPSPLARCPGDLGRGSREQGAGEGAPRQGEGGVGKGSGEQAAGEVSSITRKAACPWREREQGAGSGEWGGGGSGEQGAGDGGNYKVGEEPTLVRKLLLYAPPIIDAFVVG